MRRASLNAVVRKSLNVIYRGQYGDFAIGLDGPTRSLALAEVLIDQRPTSVARRGAPIAEKLGLTEKWVQNRLDNVRGRLGVRGRRLTV